VEGHSVVYGPQAIVGVAYDVTGLAVGVVRHDVERGKDEEVLEPLLDEREVVLVGVVLDEELKRPDAHRRVAPQHSGRDDPPSRRLAHEIGSNLARRERSGREVPQGPLAPARLVDRKHLVAVAVDAREEDVVGRVRQKPENLRVARGQKLESLGSRGDGGHPPRR
jgi:hypothetical protein